MGCTALGSIGRTGAVLVAACAVACGASEETPAESADTGATASGTGFAVTSGTGTGGAHCETALDAGAPPCPPGSSTTGSEASTTGSTGGDPGGDFVTRWSVEEEDRSITLPLVDSGSYDFTVDWGDATSDGITSRSDAAATHVYAEAGSYVVTISGTVQGWAFVNDCIEYCPQSGYCSLRDCTSEEVFKLREILNWGSVILGNEPGHFMHCRDLTLSAPDIPRLPHPSSLRQTFMGCSFSVTGTSLNQWDTRGVTDMSDTFSMSHFSDDISDWDTSNVTTMSNMFFSSTFTGDISAWDTSKVTSMINMFAMSTFTGDISSWDTSNVTSMSLMFDHSHFNGDLSGWDISNVTNMNSMFSQSELTTANYDRILVGWAAQETQPDVPFSAGFAHYSEGAPAEARATLVARGWEITDAGQAP